MCTTLNVNSTHVIPDKWDKLNVSWVKQNLIPFVSLRTSCMSTKVLILLFVTVCRTLLHCTQVTYVNLMICKNLRSSRLQTWKSWGLLARFVYCCAVCSFKSFCIIPYLYILDTKSTSSFVISFLFRFVGDTGWKYSQWGNFCHQGLSWLPVVISRNKWMGTWKEE